MDRSALDELLELFSGPRRLFYYDKDEYARYLLQRQVASAAKPLATIRQTNCSRLLDRPTIKAAMGRWGDGMLNKERLQLIRSPNPLPFRITFSEWGDAKRCRYNGNQTSRPGYNFVIQLNFANDHNQAYKKAVFKQLGWHPFYFSCHPVQAQEEFTLAWARIDLSENLEEALIEEIQSDWWKDASSEIIRRQHRKRDANGKWREWTETKSRHRLDVEEYEAYHNNVLKAYGELWSEAMLTATLQFLWEEIGVSSIFYHTYETGCQLKSCKPPRSLYTKLPKRFCFEETKQSPRFLARSVRRLPKKHQAAAKFWVV
jgi:hypothetical protein